MCIKSSTQSNNYIKPMHNNNKDSLNHVFLMFALLRNTGLFCPEGVAVD